MNEGRRARRRLLPGRADLSALRGATAMTAVLATLMLTFGCVDKAAEFLGDKAAKLLGEKAGSATSSHATTGGAVVLPTPLPPLERAIQTLRERGVDTSGGVERRGDEVRLTYETASATEYDDKLLVVWATAFGALGRVAKKKVTVVNTVGGRPVVEVSASTHDIRGMLDGAIETGEFMQRLEIVSVDRHPEAVSETGSAGDLQGDRTASNTPSAAEEPSRATPPPSTAPAAPRAQPPRRSRPTRMRRPARPSGDRSPVRRPRAKRPGR